MNSKTTLWLSVAALGLIAYIYLFELPGATVAQRSRPGSKLLPNFDPSKVSSIEIARSNQTLRAELLSDGWHLTTPRYPAQSMAIETFLNSLTNLSRQHEIPAQEIISQSGGLSPFGLDPPWTSIKLQGGTNLWQFRVGAKTLLGDAVYVQPLGASGIFTTEASWLKHLPVSWSEWRYPLLLDDSSLVFDRIAITAGSRTLKLERDSTNQLWRLVEPMATRADYGRVEYLLRQLRSARVSQFISDDPKADLEPYGLQAPEAELNLRLGSNTICQIQFGKSPTDDPSQVYARRMSHTNVVLVPRELADLVEKPYTEFRDRSLLSFRSALVDRIEAQADEAFAVQRVMGDSWRIVEPFQAPADSQLMQRFLDDLARLEIIRFEKDVVADFAPYGLVNPSRRYILKTSVTNAFGLTNQVLLEVDFGSSPPNEVDKVYCRRSDEKSVYVVPFAALERSAFALRDRHIWKFAGTNVISVTILQRNQKRELIRDSATRAWLPQDQVRNAGIEETLHRLGELEAEAWVARGLDQAKSLRVDGSEYQLRLDLSEAGQTRRLVMNLRLGVTGQPYGSIVLEQGQPVVFKFGLGLYALIAEYLSIPARPVVEL